MKLSTLALTLFGASALLVAADEKKAPLKKLTPEQQAKLARKAAKAAKDPFGFPDEAEAFYVNSRTGPVIYRGPNPTGVRTLDPSAYLPAIEQMRTMPRISSSTNAILPADGGMQVNAASPGAALGSWTNIGPGNQGGRTRALLIDPNNPSIMYAGGVGGGVWKSTDAGATWSTNTDRAFVNLAVSTLAFQPGNSNVIYAGTGEGVGNGDALRGAGIFKSVDAGATWAQLPSTNSTNFFFVGSILVSPRNTQRVYAATRTGLFRSLDAGATWSVVVGVSPSTGCTDMAMQTRRTTGYLFVSCGRTSGQGTVYRLLDSNISTGTPVLSLAGQGRSSIAIAPSNESIVYILAAQRTNNITTVGPGLGGLHGVYRSTNNGTSFTTQRQGNVNSTSTAQKINQLLLSNPIIALLTECGQGASVFLNQGWYDNVIAVDPVNADRVWVGGIDLWRSDNGGVDWGTASYWWFGKGVDPQYAHADQHAIVFHPDYNGSGNKVMFVGNDGGVQRVDDATAPVNTTLTQICGSPVSGSPAWVDRSNGYVTTQFYHGVAYPDAGRYFGGLQDNGTMRGTSPATSWSVLRGGDGGFVALDKKPSDANDVLFVENTGNSMARSTNGGASFTSVAVGSPGITPSGFQFIAPFEMNQGNKNHIWAGGFDIWLSTNQATSWTRMTGASSTCGLGAISAIAAHPLDTNRVLVGMSDGCYHYSTTALTPVAGFWPGGSTIGAGGISSFAWDPNNVEVAYATVSNFTLNTVLKTVDHGVTWAPVMGSGITALPLVPARSVVVNPANSQQVFVGTDVGVFTSIDGGASWYREITGFANVSVNWLSISATAPRKLFAFTHGRGAWVTTLADPGTPAP